MARMLGTVPAPARRPRHLGKSGKERLSAECDFSHILSQPNRAISAGKLTPQ
jgi:hypothetical protein